MASLQRRVALLMDAIEDDYQAAIVRGAAHASSPANVQVVCIAGGLLGDGTEDARSQRNFLFDLIDPAQFDGVIALSGSLGNQIGVPEFAKWVARFNGVPLVNLGVDVPGMHSVSVDCGAGTRLALLHLIETHGHRRIAFIRGPETSQEAEERYAAYRSTLEHAGIEIDPRLVLSGTWRQESGAAAVRDLFDHRGALPTNIDAIATANDYMALGALDELTQRRIPVPDEVALVGFDDLDVLRGVVPALTTVRQPIEELGRVGMQTLLSLMSERTAPLSRRLSPTLVERRSCGCARSAEAIAPRTNAPSLSFGAALMQRRDPICSSLSRAAQGALFSAGSGWEGRLFTAFLHDVTGEPDITFVAAIGRILLASRRSGIDPAVVQPVLEALKREAHECAARDAEAYARVTEVLDAARESIADFLLRTEAARKFDMLRQMRAFSEMVTVLLEAPPPDQLRQTFAERFGEVGIGFFSLGMFTEPGRVTDECVCVAARSDHTRLSQTEFPSRDLGVKEVFAGEPGPVLVQPVVFQGKPVGLVTTLLGTMETLVHEQLRVTMGAGLHGYRLAGGKTG